MPEAASGSRILIGLARESRWGEPSSEPLIFHRPVLPFSADFQRPENETGEVSTAGWKLPGLPGPVTGPVDFAVSFAAGGSLEIFEHLLRGVTRTELEAGLVHQYDMEQDPNAPETSFRIVYAYPPVDRAQVYGVKFAQVTQQIGNNTPIQSRLAGQAGHGTRIGAAETDAGNLGTWAGRPWLRGVMSDPTAGDVHVRVTRTVAGGGVQFRISVGDTPLPLFPGADVDVVYSAETGLARWQNLQDQAGADVGIWAENRDPVEILWPGTAADHGTLQVGDTWTFRKPLGWTDPVPTFHVGQRFTSAHWFVDYRAQGAADWIELPVDGGGQGTVVIGWPVSVTGGNTSKYPISMDRDQNSNYTVQLPRKFRSLFFQQGIEKHQRFELRLRWLGQQIGSANQWRESVTYEYPSVFLSAAGRPAANSTAIIETLGLVAEGGPSGEAPLRLSVVTPRNWTPFAEL